MPSKRTNDSVDRILEELSHEQAERGIRDSVTDRQVDAILQSLGHGSMEESSGGGSALGPIQKEDLPDITLGKGNNFNTEDRFSTAVLDDLLGDLPSMRAAKKNKPGPAAPARRPASVPEPRRMPEVEPKVEKQNNIQTVQLTQPVRSEPVPQPARPAPAQTAPQQPAPQVQPETNPAPQPEPRPADATSGDTTRTSVIKAFLGRRVPQADSKYLDEGKKDFTNFFGTSVAVVPDDMKSEQERQQTPKKKGLFGFGYATDTGEFEPINVSVSGRVENQSTQQLEEQLPRSQDVLPQDEPDEMELREQEPPRHHAAKKKGFFAKLLDLFTEEDEEEEDPRAELVQQLLEYKMYKCMAYELRDRQMDAERVLFKEPTIPPEVAEYEEPVNMEELVSDVTLARLNEIFKSIMKKQVDKIDPIRSKFGKIEKEEVSLSDKMAYLENYCLTHSRFSFRSLLEAQAGKMEIIVTFLAILELMKTGKIFISQEHTFDDILIQSKIVA